MPGQGPPPKRNRQRRNVPARGEWVDLAPLTDFVLPELPANEDWSPRTLAAWESWRTDPVTALYGPSELQNALDLAYIYEGWVRGDVQPTEVRQWLDRLGLNAKGKRDLRWRLKDEAPDEA